MITALTMKCQCAFAFAFALFFAYFAFAFSLKPIHVYPIRRIKVCSYGNYQVEA